LEQAIYRITQESLANVARHSHATCADVAVIYSHEAVKLEVHDNGRGFDVSKRPLGIGLRSMQERAESIGGRVSICSTPGSGTRISVIIPLNGSSKS
jgi:signal transduction histidine kinase